MNESQAPLRSSPFRPVVVVFVLFAAVAAVTAVSKWWALAERVPWQSDLARAQEEAKIARKPVLVYFTADWCGPCQAMKRNVWSDQAVAAAMEKYIPVRIDIDKQPAVAQRYAVASIPHLIVLDDQGQPTRTIEGSRESGEMIEWFSGR